MVMLSTQSSELELNILEGQLTQAIFLRNISWPTYKTMLTEMGEHRATRLAYYQGIVTLKMPSKLHEMVNRLLARIVTTLTEELGLEVVNIGSTTLERDDLEAGAEPDTGFYIQNADKIRWHDPKIPDNLPPDLVVEVDITSPSTKRLKIYQTLGIGEVWQYTKRGGLKIYQLQTNDYLEIESSIAFENVTATQLNQFLDQRQTQSDNQVIKAVRSWVQQRQ